MSRTILYIHGMGGGADSRIPSILQNIFAEQQEAKIHLIVKTYSFDPEEAAAQIGGWVKDLAPNLIIGESLGAIHAIRVKGLPHILISPSLGAPKYLSGLAPLALLPGVPVLMNQIYKPMEGERQKLVFKFKVLRKYCRHRKEALKNVPANGSLDSFFAFFGTKDHYRRYGVVSLKAYRKYFGESFELYEGTHYMEEEFIYEKLVPKIAEILGLRNTR